MSNTLSNAIKAANKKSFMRTAFLTSSAATLVMMGSMSQAYAQEAAAPVEEVVITGIRGALKEGLESKRAANATVDSISAEDVGKFPDKNVADSLQRIPGIQVQKGLTGEGQQVSIRGTDPQLTLTQLNGQDVASTDWFVLNAAKRGFNFDLMPSEMIAGLDVYKSSLAKLDEGGVGGTVIMKTRKPLDLPSGSFFGGIEYRDAEQSGQTGMAYSGMGSWKNDSESFGVLLALQSSDEVSARTTNENYWTWGSGDAYFDQDRKRTAGDLTLQFKPTDEWNMSLHAFHSKLKDDNSNSNYLIIPADGGRGIITDTTPGVHAGTVTVKPSVVGDWQANPLNLTETASREASPTTDVIDFDSTYKGDGYTLHAQLGNTKSDGGTKNEWVTDWAVPAANAAGSVATYDFSGRQVGYTFKDVNGNVISASDASQYVLQAASLGSSPRENKESYFQLDDNTETDLGVLKSVDFGYKWKKAEFSKSATKSNLQANWMIGDSMNLYNPIVSGEMNPENRNQYEASKIVYAKPSVVLAKIKQGIDSVVYDKNAYGKVDETINAFYVQGNFEGEGFSGNVGVRYVQTDATNEGYDPSLINIVKGENKYSNLLPSVNFKADLTDSVIFRASAGRTMSRAAYSDLDPSYGGQNPTLQTATQGNINIDPFLSDNTDLGVEWYFAEGSLASATLFTKSIQSFVTQTSEKKFVADANNPGIWTVTEPTNGTGGKLEGIELQYQQDYGNGFGSQVNYTYSNGEGKAGGKTVDLPGNSMNSYNVTGYYENDMFQVRLAYTWRSKYLGSALSLGGTSYVDATKGLDASFIYHVTKNIDLSLEGVNLTKEVLYNLNGNGTLSSSTEVGAKYFAGVKVRF